MLEIIIVAGVIALDQITKAITARVLTPLGTSIPVIDGVLQFTSARNTGAAWGILEGKKWFFLILTLFVVLYICFFLLRGRKRMTVLARITLCLLLSGALGNAIDRFIFSYVRDFIDVFIIDFPIFNVADCALTVGCILLIIDMLFMKNRSLFDVKFGPKADAEAQEPPNKPDAQ